MFVPQSLSWNTHGPSTIQNICAQSLALRKQQSPVHSPDEHVLCFETQASRPPDWFSVTELRSLQPLITKYLSLPCFSPCAVGEWQCILPAGAMVTSGVVNAIPQGRYPQPARELRAADHQGLHHLSPRLSAGGPHISSGRMHENCSSSNCSPSPL